MNGNYKVNMQVVRTHDEFYAKVDAESPPKDSFIQIANLIADYKNQVSQIISIADFGCAAGAFVNYLTARFPEDSIIGYEYLESLVQVAKVNYPHIQIERASVLEVDSVLDSSIDVLTMLGVLSIFDDIA